MQLQNILYICIRIKQYFSFMPALIRTEVIAIVGIFCPFDVLYIGESMDVEKAFREE